MDEEPQTQSIRDRINAFNVAGQSSHLGRAPITANTRKNEIPQRPSIDNRSHSTTAIFNGFNRSDSNGIGNEPNVQRRDGILPPPSNITSTGSNQQIRAKPPPPPRLPPRKPSELSSPALPPRRPSDSLVKKASNESISSTISSISTISSGQVRNGGAPPVAAANGRVKAPPFDPASLPTLPPRRTSGHRPSFDANRPAILNGSRPVTQRKPSFPQANKSPTVTETEVIQDVERLPALPSRPAKPERSPPRRLPPPVGREPASARKSALAFGLNKADDEARPITTTQDDSSLSMASESAINATAPGIAPPDIAKLLATKPKPGQHPRAASSCLTCRDFSAVDAHAARFPRQQVPSIDWLAHQLTSPFPSLTDQARCIFTWLHHNISYDVVSFFGGNVQRSTPASTLQSGLAVCEGYSSLFTAIASKVGLETVVVGGHGKGFGFASLAPGSAIPPESPGGHAWNAVKIDNGYWKLIDCCWGAGHVNGKGQPYGKKFSPRMFTMSNVEFGLRHYPENRRYFFVEQDGLQPPSWHDYYVGPLGGEEALQVYSGVAESEGISESSILPRQMNVPTSGPPIRFQFSRVCEHWDPVKNGNGLPFVFILSIKGVDGREDDYLPFETNGHSWWLDVEPRRLGCRGQKISVYTVDSVDGQSGRGLTVDGYRQAKGRKAMGFGGLAMWKLV